MHAGLEKTTTTSQPHARVADPARTRWTRPCPQLYTPIYSTVFGKPKTVDIKAPITEAWLKLPARGYTLGGLPKLATHRAEQVARKEPVTRVARLHSPVHPNSLTAWLAGRMAGMGRTAVFGLA